MKSRLILGLSALPLALAACGDSPDTERDRSEAPAAEEAADERNPLLVASDPPYGAPAFDRIRAEHFPEAIEKAMAEHMAEVEAIADNPEAPSFENTIVEMERSGQLLARVMRVFSALAGAHTNEELQGVQREFSPKLSAHQDAINLNAALFERVDSLYQEREELDLDPESKRLLERYHTDFVRAGARLSESEQDRLREINTRLAELGTEFSQKVLAEVNDSAVVVEDRDKLDGLSDSQIRRAAEEAEDRGLEGKYVITLLNTSGQPPLSRLTNRDLRERVHTASLNRGSRGNEHDTREIVVETVKLRGERARMLGYDTHADYILEEQTASDLQTVNDLHDDINPIAMSNARQEADDIQAIIDETEDEPFELASWDWAFYAEKVRQERYAFDESDVRPYFEFESVMENGVFYSAEKLFGITFEERHDIPVYHDTVRVYEVFEEDGTPLGLMYSDMYSRGSKRGGAWMNSYQIQSELLGGQPIVGIHLNISHPGEGEPTLLTWDETTTLFHEFGHAIHGLFSDVRYPRFSGTSVPRDFVEYPSQVYEMWASWPEVLANYARHYETGEQIPEELLERVLEAQQFNQGFRTAEYMAASTIDQAWHQLQPEDVPPAEEAMDFEARVLAEHDMDFAPVPPRYRTPYFSHMMGGYSAGYYSYIWSEVLDADSVLWFEENGGLTRENGEHFRSTILSSGGTMDAMDLYMEFAGREPKIEALLERRGLLDD